MSERKCYLRQKWYDFGKRLLATRGEDEQQQFLEACLSRDDFLEYMDEYLPIAGIDGDSALGKFDHQFTELEFIEPPLETTQKYIWEAFAPADDGRDEELYADCCFWGVVVREMVERNLIEASWLAAGASDTHNGAGQHNIENALSAGNEDKAKAMDDSVRRILRSMCNPAPRGARIVFNDFPLGKSWWRWRWAERMAYLLNIEREDILEGALKSGNYATIAAKMHSGGSYLSPDNVFGGLILFLRDPQGAQMSGKRLGKVIDELAAQSAWQAIELRPPTDNRSEVSKLHRALPKESSQAE